MSWHVCRRVHHKKTFPDKAPFPSTIPRLVVTGRTDSTISLAWSPSTDNVGVTGYRSYATEALGGSVFFATVSATTATVPLPTINTSWWYYARARDAAGNLSIASNRVGAGTLPTTPPSSPPTSQSSTQGPGKVNYDRRAEWRGGFVATVTITNPHVVPVDGWTLAVTFGGDRKIATAWGATYVQSGPAVTMKSLPWNAAIPAGAASRSGCRGVGARATRPPLRSRSASPARPADRRAERHTVTRRRQDGG